MTAAIAAGADPEGLHPELGSPLLSIACDSGDADVVEAMLDGGASIELADDSIGYTPLMCAVMANSLSLVERLLARGANPNVRATSDIEGGPTPLTLTHEIDDATQRHAIANALLDAGADANAPRIDGWTPLMLAAHRGDLAMIERLLALGARADVTKGEDATSAADIALHHGHREVVARLERAGASDPAAAAADRIAAHWSAIDRWFVEHAPPCHHKLARATGADADAIAVLERAIGGELPADFRAHLARYGAGVPFYEYAGFGTEAIVSRWRGLRDLDDKGTFATFEPREIEAVESRVQYRWWHAGWIPFAQDGGGNLYCIDLVPGEHGSRGQVIGWEIHGGPTAPIAPSFEAFVRRYRQRLESGKLRYDESSGIFDDVS